MRLARGQPKASRAEVFALLKADPVGRRALGSSSLAAAWLTAVRVSRARRFTYLIFEKGQVVGWVAMSPRLGFLSVYVSPVTRGGSRELLRGIGWVSAQGSGPRALIANSNMESLRVARRYLHFRGAVFGYSLFSGLK